MPFEINKARHRFIKEIMELENARYLRKFIDLFCYEHILISCKKN